MTTSTEPSGSRHRRRRIAVASLLALAGSVGRGRPPARARSPRVRAATEKYHSLAAAEAAGYGKFYVAPTRTAASGRWASTTSTVASSATRRSIRCAGGGHLRAEAGRWPTASSASSTSCSRTPGTRPQRPPSLFGQPSSSSRPATATACPVLRAAPLAVAAEPERDVQRLEPEGQLPRQRRRGLDPVARYHATTAPLSRGAVVVVVTLGRVPLVDGQVGVGGSHWLRPQRRPDHDGDDGDTHDPIDAAEPEDHTDEDQRADKDDPLGRMT